jgi:hypothetical protein
MELAIDKNTEQAIVYGAKTVNVSVTQFITDAVLDRLDEIEAEKSAEKFLEMEARGEVEYVSNEELAKKYGYAI